MEKQSFFYYTFLNPVLVSMIFFIVMGAFLSLYSCFMNENTSKYNALLSFIKKYGASQGILGALAGISTFAFLVTTLGRSNLYQDNALKGTYSDAMMIYNKIIYISIPIIILFLLIQPRIAEWFDIRKGKSKKYNSLISILNQYSKPLENYNKSYIDKTRVEISQIITGFDLIKDKLSQERYIRGNRRNLYRAINNMDVYETEAKSLFKRFEDFQAKEVKVYDFMTKLDFKIKFEANESEKRKLQQYLEYVNSKYELDVLTAYDIIQTNMLRGVTSNAYGL